MTSADDSSANSMMECSEFHIVGVGASAGGLEAIVGLLKEIPADTGMSFIIVQHLSPDFKSHMEELVRRRTSMAVHVVTNGIVVEPNSIYLIPPKMEMVISDGKLLLTEKNRTTVSHPIDQFLRSLATDVGRYAIGIILSGTGSDGSRGIREISEAGGLTIIQDPETAKFDGMPLSAMATNHHDLVLSPELMGEALIRYVKNGLDAIAIGKELKLSADLDEYDHIFNLLQKQHGIDFKNYKISTVSRRFQRRVDMLNLKNLEAYLSYLNNNPSEINELYKDLLIGVTRFLRDDEAFDLLKSEVISELASRENSNPIRGWVAGCATGEEAYTIAILFAEAFEHQSRKPEIKIFATDAHQDSLHFAARGIYSEQQLSDLPAEYQKKYFTKHADGFLINPDIRRMIVFAPHNILNDSPFTQIDLVSCRNMLIYLQPSSQKKVLSLFHFALKANGYLFLGPSESTGDLNDEFENINSKWRLFKKRRDVRLPIDTRMTFKGFHDTQLHRPRKSVRDSGRMDSRQLAIYDKLLDRKMPPGVLVDDQFEISHIFGQMHKYLTIKPGRPTNSLLDLIHPGLRATLHGAMQQALHKKSMIKFSGLSLPVEDQTEIIDLVVEPIEDQQHGLLNLLVEISSKAPNPDHQTSIHSIEFDADELSKDRIDTLESELKYSQENLQATIEEMETSNEELQATNEELIASNEELQSTNEELHSVNEELFTVNSEYQLRVEELAQANADMDNLLATTRVGVIFLDTELCIRRYTPEIARLLHLVPQDIGRTIAGFTHHLKRDTLIDDLNEVIQTQRELEVEISDQIGKAFLLRAMPNRNGEHVDGVVLTLVDIQKLKATQNDLMRFQYMAEASADSILLMTMTGDVVYSNPAMQELLDYGKQELEKQSLFSLNKLMSYEEFQKFVESLMKEEIRSQVMTWVNRNNQVIPIEMTANLVQAGRDHFICLHLRDIRERMAMNEVQDELITLFDLSHDAIFVWDYDSGILKWNAGAIRLYGYQPDEVIGKLPSDVLKTIYSTTPDHIASELSNTGSWTGTLMHETKEGRKVMVSSSQQAITKNDGTQRIMQINRDITKDHENKQKLQAAMDSAERANKAKSEFLANMSHELRTPMTAMLGFADILRMESDEVEFIEKVDTIKRNGQYLLTLLNDILDLSKIESGKFDFEQKPVGLVSLMDDVKSLMTVRSKATGIPLGIEYDTEIPETITGDYVRLRQILVNLIGNGLKFTDHGSVKVCVGIRKPSEAEHHKDNVDCPCLYFKVIDTGIGMSEDQIRQLFQPFSQVSSDTSRQHEGTGLGLSISQRLAQKMNGAIKVQSQLGEGSCFELVLPVDQKQLQHLITPDKSSKSQSDSSIGQNTKLPAFSGRILLADDRRDVWMVAKYFLEKCGAQVTIAENGREAVNYVCQQTDSGDCYDLILMDMQMPVLSGKEAVIEIRQKGLTIPIIALTADAMDGQRQACLDFGCNEYLTKPIDGTLLAQTVQRLLNER